MEMMQPNLLQLTDVLNEIGVFERGQTDRQFIGLAILLYNHG